MSTRHGNWLVPLIIPALLWMELAQAFCFSFGTGSHRRAGNYHGTFPAPGYPVPGYPAYPFTPPVPGWYGPPVFGFPPVPANYPGFYAPLKQE